MFQLLLRKSAWRGEGFFWSLNGRSSKICRSGFWTVTRFHELESFWTGIKHWTPIVEFPFHKQVIYSYHIIVLDASVVLTHYRLEWKQNFWNQSRERGFYKFLQDFSRTKMSTSLQSLQIIFSFLFTFINSFLFCSK